MPYSVKPAADAQFRLSVPESDESSVKAIRAGQYPAALRPHFDILRRLKSSPGRVLDLGGYMGAFGLAAAAVGHDVVIVEANPENARWIRASLTENRFRCPVRLIEAAVGEINDRVRFHQNGSWGHVEVQSTQGIRITMMTLPTLLEAVGWTDVDFIKMDVEGCEAGVLRGAGPWFALGYRPIIVYEANGHTLHLFGETQATLRNLLTARGYHQYELEADGHVRALQRFEPRVLVDYVASPTPLADVLPARSPLAVARQTMYALRSASRPSRTHAVRAIRDIMF